MIAEEERTCNGSMKKTVELGIDSSLSQIKVINYLSLYLFLFSSYK